MLKNKGGINMILTEKNGMKIEEKEEGFKITSAKGTILKLDKEGELIARIDPRDSFFSMNRMARQVVVSWLVFVQPKTKAQEEFVEVIRDILSDSAKCYVYKIATIEPSTRGISDIGYEEGADVCCKPLAAYWEEKARNFVSGSRLATLEELYLFYAYRIAMGYWTIEYVCDDSSSDGNYKDSPVSSKKKDKAGVKEVGGFKDGIGNTIKLVMKDEVPTLVGGSYEMSGKTHPVAKIFSTEEYEMFNRHYGRYADEVSGVVVISKG